MPNPGIHSAALAQLPPGEPGLAAPDVSTVPPESSLEAQHAAHLTLLFGQIAERIAENPTRVLVALRNAAESSARTLQALRLLDQDSLDLEADLFDEDLDEFPALDTGRGGRRTRRRGQRFVDGLPGGGVAQQVFEQVLQQTQGVGQAVRLHHLADAARSLRDWNGGTAERLEQLIAQEVEQLDAHRKQSGTARPEEE